MIFLIGCFRHDRGRICTCVHPVQHTQIYPFLSLSLSVTTHVKLAVCIPYELVGLPSPSLSLTLIYICWTSALTCGHVWCSLSIRSMLGFGLREAYKATQALYLSLSPDRSNNPDEDDGFPCALASAPQDAAAGSEKFKACERLTNEFVSSFEYDPMPPLQV